MMSSLFSGVSGLTTNMLRMDVIGNNVANVNTVGYKSSNVTFEDTMSQLLHSAAAPLGNTGGVNPMQVGTGAMVGTVEGNFSQGSLESTGLSTDLAIQGQAFFVLSNGAASFYSRAGSFHLDGSGRLVDPSNGYTVQGFAYDRTSDTYANLPSSLRIPMGEVEPAMATSTLTYQGNLDADSDPKGTRAQSSILYGADGQAASATTTLDNLKGDSNGVTDLLSAGDTIAFSATVGGLPVSGTYKVTATSTLGDLMTQIQTTLNSAPEASGINVSVDANGRLQISSPDALGTKAQVAGFALQATDATTTPRDAFNSVAAVSTTQAARDPGVVTDESKVYDSLGYSHVVRLEFTRVLGANQFTWKATVDGGATPIVSGGTGKVIFNADGSLNGMFYDATGNTIPTALSFAPTTGAKTPLAIKLDAGTQAGFSGMTFMQSASTLTAANDGYANGTATDFKIDSTGTVMSVFSNGVTRPVGKIALAQFINPTGLLRSGDNLFQSSVNSGEPTVAQAGGAINATIADGSLEQSNVDLSMEFTNMILAQRGFQASARTITTSDSMLNDLLNLKQ